MILLSSLLILFLDKFFILILINLLNIQIIVLVFYPVLFYVI